MSASIPESSSSQYYEDLSQGKQAIRNQKRPGIVFLTNPMDEDNQRVNQILKLSQFQDLLSDMIYIKVDVDKNPKALSQYGIYKTPSMVLYDSEGLMRKRIQSISDMNYLLKEIRRLN